MSRILAAMIALGLSLAVPAAAQPKGPPGKAQSEKHKAAKENTAERKDAREERKTEPKQRKGKHKEAREGRKGKHKRVREERKDERSEGQKQEDAQRSEKLKERAKRLRENGKGKVAERLEKRADKIAKGRELHNDKPRWKERLKDKKLQRVKRLKKKYGGALKDKQVQDEIKRHARVEARLSRMQNLAEEKDDDALVERIEILRQKESAKHQKRMATLTAGAKKAKKNQKEKK